MTEWNNKYLLIKKQEEYILFLGEHYDEVFSFAFAHGWRDSEDIIDKGKILREEIEQLKAKI